MIGRASLSQIHFKRPHPIVLILGALVVIGVVAALIRYIWGIGAISNLNNSYPWGFWISFDLLCGVALGAGAFTMAATVYILNLKQFRPLLRPSILTGLLGYIMVIIALLVDLGRPERIWHMIIYQNGHSVLLEIGLCVMLYTTVLLLEFLPVILEKPSWQKPIHILHTITMPLVILGVVLSTLHQSSLGSLFLIMPAKLHPLWYTPLLPLLFFITAVGVGLGMIIMESSLSSRAFHRGLEIHLLSKLARVVPYVLGLYLVIRFGDLAIEGKLGLLFTSGIYSVLFWAEIIIGAVIPIVLFSRRSVRESSKGLLIGAAFIIAGLMLNRFDVSWLALTHLGGQPYTPNLLEFAVSFGIVAAGVLTFGFIAKYFPLFESEEHVAEHVAAPAPTTVPATARSEAA
ncbi:MAG TPA: Ni/Fe-hydrogenase cytochrome b subunit [Anaerolineae bacterium]|nr:Ni/Fe-hydrogenase cytochrome b subunit [Anaerolineae bacterium]